MKKFLISILKSGTNMMDQMIGTTSNGSAEVISCFYNNLDHPLSSVIDKMENDPHPFLRGHLIYDKVYEDTLKSNYNYVFFLYRDFRDCIVSSLFWDSRKLGQKVSDVTLSEEEIDKGLFDQMAKWSFVYGRYADWLDVDFIHKFRYEDFMDDIDGQVKRLADILGGNSTQMKNFFRSPASNTFRKGGKGDWKLYFKPHHLEVFWDTFGNVMEKFGYIE